MFYALTTIKIKKLNSKEIKKIDLQLKDFFKKKVFVVLDSFLYLSVLVAKGCSLCLALSLRLGLESVGASASLYSHIPSLFIICYHLNLLVLFRCTVDL